MHAFYVLIPLFIHLFTLHFILKSVCPRLDHSFIPVSSHDWKYVSIQFTIQLVTHMSDCRFLSTVQGEYTEDISKSMQRMKLFSYAMIQFVHAIAT